ncbi:uncharacterized protein LOC118183547 isoform X2 [Stegodyphus dumicola]|uniref:uncharacterized protein LOC118183547 isoform X2 n=1 Tax=Stegodyphus dumicola TaxID=202533 RepID=UPI0015ABBF1F|nr:uncharacterized protein LOC118183547 isoform X2 [Stegodyphus dumicola]
MTDKKEKMMDLDKTTEVLSLKKINDGKEINDLNLKAQHPFEVMLYVNHFKSSEIKVGVDGRVVIVNGHHEARTDAHGFIRRKFSCKYNLPKDVKPENLLANFTEDCIFTIKAYDEKEYMKHDDENFDMTDKKEKILDGDKKTVKTQHPFEERLYINHFKSSEINVGVYGRTVIVNGHHEARTDTHGFIRRKFSRKYNLPEAVEPENLLAIFNENGILTIQAYDEKEYKKHEDENFDERRNPFETKEFKDGKMFSQKYKGLKNDEVKFIGGVTQLLEKKQSIEDQETKPAKVKPCVTDLASKSDKSKQTPTAGQAEIKTPATVYSPKLDEVKKASDAVKDPKSVVAKQTPASGLSPKSVVAKQTPASGLSPKSVQTKQTPASGLSPKSVQTKQTPASCLSPKSVQTKQTPASCLSPKSVQTKQAPASGVSSKSVQGKQTATAGQAEVKSLAAVKSPKPVRVMKTSVLVKDPKSIEMKKPVGEGQASKPGEMRLCKMQASTSDDGKPTSTSQASKSRRKSDEKSPKSTTGHEER